MTPTVLMLGLCAGLSVAGLFFLANLLVDQFIRWTDLLLFRRQRAVRGEDRCDRKSSGRFAPS